MSSLGFLSSVYYWKFSGIFLWSSAFYSCFFLLSSFVHLIYPFSFSPFFFAVGFFLLPLDIFAYTRALTVLSVPHSVLPLKKWSKRIMWFLMHWLWFTSLSMVVTTFVRSLVYSFIAAYFHATILPFSVFMQEFVFKKSKRQNRSYVLTNSYLFPTIPAMILTIIGVFVSPFFAIHIASMFVMSDIVYRICEIVAGETVSFSSSDPSRLPSGMESDDIVKFWAYTDLLLTSLDQCEQGRELLFHSNGKCFGKIVDVISEQFSKYAESHFNLFEEIEPSNYSLTRLNDGSLSKDQKRKILNNMGPGSKHEGNKPVKKDPKAEFEKSHAKKSLFNQLLRYLKIYQIIELIISYLRKYQRYSTTRNSQLNAVADSIIIVEATRAIDALIKRAPSDDKYGIVQSQIEKILNSLLMVSRATKNSANNIWIDYDYETPFKRYETKSIGKTPVAITSKVYQTVSKTIDNFVVKYGSKIDESKITEKNMKELKVYKL